MGNSFKVLPDARPLAEGLSGGGREPEASEGSLARTLRAPRSPHREECAMRGKSLKNVVLCRPGCVSKALFPLHSKTYFS